MQTKPTLLLHSCCAPCSSSVLERLCQNFDVTVLYYNPNIYPKQEYDRRLQEQKTFLKKIGIKMIEGEYNETEYLAAISGKEHLPEKSSRCFCCYQFRLAKTAEFAQKLGFDFFTTTLSVSPHKNSAVINEVGRKVAQEEGVRFLEESFKKKDGYLNSIKLAKKYDLYRQNYCGCRFSLRKEDLNGKEDK